MKVLITVILALSSISAAAQTSIKTSLIEQWGYSQDRLLLITKNGETIKVSPTLCGLSEFNKTLSSGVGLNLDIPASRLRQNTTFYIVQSEGQGVAKMRCRVGSIDV